MKRSERQKQLMEVFNRWRGQTHQRSEDALISRILDSEERETGLIWEPEPLQKRIFIGEHAGSPVPILCHQMKSRSNATAPYGTRVLTALEYAEAVRRFNSFNELEEIYDRLKAHGSGEQGFSFALSDLRTIIDGEKS